MHVGSAPRGGELSARRCTSAIAAVLFGGALLLASAVVRVDGHVGSSSEAERAVESAPSAPITAPIRWEIAAAIA